MELTFCWRHSLHARLTPGSLRRSSWAPSSSSCEPIVPVPSSMLPGELSSPAMDLFLFLLPVVGECCADVVRVTPPLADVLIPARLEDASIQPSDPDNRPERPSSDQAYTRCSSSRRDLRCSWSSGVGLVSPMIIAQPR
jgi:hypothetical protein